MGGSFSPSHSRASRHTPEPETPSNEGLVCDKEDIMKHPGFKSVQAKIAKKQGVSKKRAGAILAASTRRASPTAKKRNPRLKRVKY